MKNHNLKQNILENRGFTLLELLIYIAILSGLVLIISNTFISLSKGQAQSNARNEVDSSIRFATELLRQDIKNASIVSIPSLIGDTSNSLTLTRNGVVIIYDVSGGVLRRKEDSGNPVNVTNENILVETPIFTRTENVNSVFNTKSITLIIDMTFSYNANSPDFNYSTSLQTAVNLYSYN